MKLLPVVVAAGVLLPCFSQEAQAHPRYSHGCSSYRAYSSYHSYRPSYYRYSHRPSFGVSLNFGPSYYPNYYRSYSPGYYRSYYPSYYRSGYSRPSISFGFSTGCR